MLIAMWTEDFESDPTLGIMEECYENLKAKSMAQPHSVPDIALIDDRLQI
jgi:signal transducing adaptor molecule